MRLPIRKSRLGNRKIVTDLGFQTKYNCECYDKKIFNSKGDCVYWAITVKGYPAKELRRVI